MSGCGVSRSMSSFSSSRSVLTDIGNSFYGCEYFAETTEVELSAGCMSLATRNSIPREHGGFVLHNRCSLAFLVPENGFVRPILRALRRGTQNRAAVGNETRKVAYSLS